eukprot:917476-Prorocentrum_minimum.AAC.1
MFGGGLLRTGPTYRSCEYARLRRNKCERGLRSRTANVINSWSDLEVAYEENYPALTGGWSGLPRWAAGVPGEPRGH